MHVPLEAGVNTKADEKALAFPQLAKLENGKFGKVGGIQKIHGFSSMALDIDGGGTLSNIRAVTTCGDELLCFTHSALYSWSPTLAKWMLRNSHFAIAAFESPVFSNTSEQVMCERAQLDNVTVYAWKDTGAAGKVYCAAVDSTTGTVLVAPTDMSATSRPRLVALTDKILLFAQTATNTIGVKAITPTAADLSSSISAAFTDVNTTFLTGYDVAKLDSTTAVIACSDATVTQYKIATVTEALVITSSTKTRDCDGVIAVAVGTAATKIAVVRLDGNDIETDILTTGLVDDVVNVATGTKAGGDTFANVTACWTETATYTCYVFWTINESTASNLLTTDTWKNTVTAAGTAGTAVSFKLLLGLASRAWLRDGTVWVILSFSFATQVLNQIRSQAQNSYFIYQHDGNLHGVLVPGEGGGSMSAQGSGWLPSVTETVSDTFKVCLNKQEKIAAGIWGNGADTYGNRSPQDCTIVFNDNRARRTAQLGLSTYISGALPAAYDGLEVTEIGFRYYPFAMTASPTGAGSLTGAYSYKSFYEWYNAKGEKDISTTATIVQATAASDEQIDMTLVNCIATRKGVGDRDPASIGVYRTEANPFDDSVFYRVAAVDPSDTTGDNRFVVNSLTAATSAFDDALLDSTLVKLGLEPNLNELDHVAPPTGRVIAVGQNRLWMTAIPGYPYRVAYSKIWQHGMVAAFNDAGKFDIPRDGGIASAIAPLDSGVVVFSQRNIYLVNGAGPDNTGAGGYSEPQLISADTGCSVDVFGSVVQTPVGIIFQSPKGIYCLKRNFTLEYIGAPVEDFTSTQRVVSALLCQDRQEVFFLCDTGSALVYDYAVGQWSTYPSLSGVSAVNWTTGVGTYSGKIVYATASAIYLEDSTIYTRAGSGYALGWETPWMPIGEMAGYGRCYRVHINGKKKGTHNLRIRAAYDYNESGGAVVWTDDKEWTVSDTGLQGYLVRFSPSIQKCSAIKLRVDDVIGSGSNNPPTNEAYRVTGLTFEIGVKGGGARPNSGKDR